MAAPSVTHIFVAGTTMDPTQVNKNFTDIINGITDGTKDLTINALTTKGTVTFEGSTLNLDAAAPVLEFGAATTWTINNITELDLGACQKIDMGGTSIAETVTPDRNTLYPNNIVKAYAKIVVVAGPSMVVSGGFGVSAATKVGPGTAMISFKNDFDLTTAGEYVVLGTIGHGFATASSQVIAFSGRNQASGSVEITGWDEDGASAIIDTVGHTYHVVILGVQ